MGSRTKRIDIVWRKSTYSVQGECIEIALTAGGVLVRDSKDPDGSILFVCIQAWRAVLSIINIDHSESWGTGALLSGSSHPVNSALR